MSFATALIANTVKKNTAAKAINGNHCVLMFVDWANHAATTVLSLRAATSPITNAIIENTATINPLRKPFIIAKARAINTTISMIILFA